MTQWLAAIWRQWHNNEAAEKAEVDQIDSLQKAAQRRRAEHAEVLAGQAETEAPTDLAASRKRVQEAEVAYAQSLTRWNNKQFGFRTG